ncbi:hypothetical protein HUU40_00310 [candidate division KSB1 bacterium]|nr:hypothetical protein [candidate division KSB1 bacterium]
MKKFKLKEPYPTSDGRCSIFEKDGKVSCIITFRAIETHGKIETIGLVVHEVLHVWQEVLLNMGETKPSPEFESYSVMAITQNILEEMERAGKFKL